MQALSEKIKTRKAIVAIIGVGYVGGALAKGASSAGFEVIGFTRSAEKAKNINKENIGYKASANPKDLSRCDIICICVPTPVHEDKSPDLTPLQDALEMTAKNMRAGTLIIIESTVAAGTSRNYALPILKTSGFTEEEFFLSFSPERVDPGNKKFTMQNTPKVVAGLNQTSSELSQAFYESFVESVVPVSSLETAEMTKILENTFRFVNISLVNELLTYANNMGVDLWEVISASTTKPFGYMPHYPGPGIGGHCIAVDPYYLLDDARKRGVSLGIIEQAGRVNEAQPGKVVQKALDVLKSTNGQKLTHQAFIIGLSYKEDVDDRRESPSLKVWELLEKENIKVAYHDPYISQLNGQFSEELSESNMLNKDIIIITTPHSIIDYKKLISFEKPIIDTKNVLKDYSFPYIYRI